jgi:hypothetical protein
MRVLIVKVALLAVTLCAISPPADAGAKSLEEEYAESLRNVGEAEKRATVTTVGREATRERCRKWTERAEEEINAGLFANQQPLPTGDWLQRSIEAGRRMRYFESGETFLRIARSYCRDVPGYSINPNLYAICRENIDALMAASVRPKTPLPDLLNDELRKRNPK